MVSMLVPLRSCVLRYMCKLSDQDLRTPTIKSMAGKYQVIFVNFLFFIVKTCFYLKDLGIA